MDNILNNVFLRSMASELIKDGKLDLSGWKYDPIYLGWWNKKHYLTISNSVKDEVTGKSKWGKPVKQYIKISATLVAQIPKGQVIY
jgi:hypothetical protein